ncbi:MAG: flagellar basal body-associated FliL family protein [Leptospirales bacterium]
MADDDDENDEESGSAKPPRNIKKLVLIGVAVLALLGGGAFFFMKHGHKTSGDIPMTPKEMEKLIKNNPIVDLKPFVVNLTTQSGENSKYLKIRIAFKLDNTKVGKEIDYRMPEIQNVILILLGSETSEDLQTTGGKLALRNQIRHRVNSILTLGRVTSVYFTEFVIQ